MFLTPSLTREYSNKLGLDQAEVKLEVIVEVLAGYEVGVRVRLLFQVVGCRVAG